MSPIEFNLRIMLNTLDLHKIRAPAFRAEIKVLLKQSKVGLEDYERIEREFDELLEREMR